MQPLTKTLVSIAAIAAMLVMASPAHAQTPISAESLKAHFAKMGPFTAEAEQTKTARFLARPLVSKVHLRYTAERIEWETLTPIHSSVVIDKDGLHVQGGAGPGTAKQDPRAMALIRFIRNLFALDFAALEQDFTLSFEGRSMKAAPKESSSLKGMLGAIEMRFTDSLDLESLQIVTPDETSKLLFQKLTPEARPTP